MFQSSQTCIPSTRDFNRDLQSQQNVYRLDVGNYHRICDAQKHLVHTLAKAKAGADPGYFVTGLNCGEAAMVIRGSVGEAPGKIF